MVNVSLGNLIEPPVPDSAAGRAALKALIQERNILAALQALHREMGDVFRIPLPGFSPTVLVGPEANHFVAVTAREDLRWRPEGDPVSQVLRQGLLVTDGDLHDRLRKTMNKPLHKQLLGGYVDSMWQHTDEVSSGWATGQPVDMLVEMRKIALLVLMDTLYAVDFRPQIERLWDAILRTLAFISPGMWVIWPGIPRPGYRRAIDKLNAYLYQIIAERRAAKVSGSDLLGELIEAGLDDDLIRDQLITILIAGHDTSTALLAWSLYLLGAHPEDLARAQDEVDLHLGIETPTLDTVNRLEFLERVNKEALRLYPPIHIGNRMAAQDLAFQDYHIPAGTRLVYSIYLTHRHPDYWDEPERFDPDRFLSERVQALPHYAYVPFGGGPRNCIGMAFAQVEAKVILARLLQNYKFKLASDAVHPHMGATLEPRPGVKMTVQPRHEA
jgi:cytochrome P450